MQRIGNKSHSAATAPVKKRKSAMTIEQEMSASPESTATPENHKFDYVSQLNYEDIVRSLNGFARIVKYRS